jgi:Ser/Thr protein kinase RdoA (MazF antagonist)
LDNIWERSIPFYSINEVTASHLLRKFDLKLKVERILPLTEGKRNTNYRIYTSDRERTFLLRIFPPGEESWRKEASLRAALSGRVPLQKLYFLDRDETIENRAYGIFEYAEGKSLLELMKSGFVPDERLLHHIGSLLAVIHSQSYDRQGFLDEKLEVVEELPSLETWYDFFLSHHARKRLGADIAKQIEMVVLKKREMLREIGRRFSFIHGDFRPTNLLVNEGKVSSVLDWEFAMVQGFESACRENLAIFDDLGRTAPAGHKKP